MESLKKVLITGAAGFIGSHLVEKLLDLNCYVIGLDNLSSGNMNNISTYMSNPNFIFVEGDITDYELCCKLCEGVDYVFHEAAINSVPKSIEFPDLYFSNNILGFNNVLDASRKNNVKKFIYASSSSVYGDSLALPKIEDKIGESLSPYALSKQNNESWAKLYSNLYGINTIGLRYFNVFGPRQKSNSEYSAVIPKFINNILNEKTVNVYGNGNQKRDFTYIENVIEANIKAMYSSSNIIGEIYNVSGGASASINDLLLLIEKKLGKKAKVNYCAHRKGDVLISYADISKAKKELKYIPIIDFNLGLEKTIEWYKDKGI